jgi:hypothetical protein
MKPKKQPKTSKTRRKEKRQITEQETNKPDKK